jgi:hypothetical protein
MEGDVTILEAGTGNSPNRYNDDNNAEDEEEE